MLRCPVGVVIIVLAFVSQSFGFEVGAIIRKIDVDKRIAVVFANGRDCTVKKVTSPNLPWQRLLPKS